MKARIPEMLHTLLYVGPKEEKAVDVPGRLGQLVFKRGPLSEKGQPYEDCAYADVTEKEGRALLKRSPDLFKWPEGTVFGPQVVTREEYEALLARVDFLYGLLQAHGILDENGKLTTITNEADLEAAAKKVGRKRPNPETPAGATEG